MATQRRLIPGKPEYLVSNKVLNNSNFNTYILPLLKIFLKYKTVGKQIVQHWFC